jgi:hypothetical protein
LLDLKLKENRVRVTDQILKEVVLIMALSITIIGAAHGGLVNGVDIDRRRIDVDVFESARELRRNATEFETSQDTPIFVHVLPKLPTGYNLSSNL